MRTTTFSVFDYLPASLREFPKRRAAETLGIAALAGVVGLGVALLTWSVEDPSLNHATNAPVHNLLGAPGAIAADMVMQMLGPRLHRRARPAGVLGLAAPDRAPARPRAAQGGALCRRRRRRGGARLALARSGKLAAADGPRRRRRRRAARRFRAAWRPARPGAWPRSAAPSRRSRFSASPAASGVGFARRSNDEAASKTKPAAARRSAYATTKTARTSRASGSCRSARSSTPS